MTDVRGNIFWTVLKGHVKISCCHHDKVIFFRIFRLHSVRIGTGIEKIYTVTFFLPFLTAFVGITVAHSDTSGEDADEAAGGGGATPSSTITAASDTPGGPLSRPFSRHIMLCRRPPNRGSHSLWNETPSALSLVLFSTMFTQSFFFVILFPAGGAIINSFVFLHETIFAFADVTHK